MTLIIICTAGAVDATNALMRGAPFFASGDNVTVPIVVDSAGDIPPQFYGCNWKAFDVGHFVELKQLAKDIDGLYVYNGANEGGFDKCLKRLRIKRKESDNIH